MSNYLERWSDRAEEEYFQECLREYAAVGKRYEFEQRLIQEACEINPEFKKLHEQYEIMKALLIDEALNG